MRLGLLYTGAMTLAHAYVHISKTVKTSPGVYHKSVTYYGYWETNIVETNS
jgi:hypothetical protein